MHKIFFDKIPLFVNYYLLVSITFHRLSIQTSIKCEMSIVVYVYFFKKSTIQIILIIVFAVIFTFFQQMSRKIHVFLLLILITFHRFSLGTTFKCDLICTSSLKIINNLNKLETVFVLLRFFDQKIERCVFFNY